MKAIFWMNALRTNSFMTKDINLAEELLALMWETFTEREKGENQFKNWGKYK